jgi:1,2-phenylacetyl-CoA epoxidase catalytic subunit
VAEPAPNTAAAANAPFSGLVESLARAKSAAAQMYLACASGAPTPTSHLALVDMARDEGKHADRLSALLSHTGRRVEQPVVTTIGCGLGDESWGSALMAAFALDQAATGALVALERAPRPELAATASAIVREERAHQAFAIATFKEIAAHDAATGRRLALEMVEARNWVQGAFPRRAQLVALVEAGALPADAPRLHDRFLASLGDRIQDALGVLGEL